MPRWEVCELEHVLVRDVPVRGRIGGVERYYSWRVILFTTNGEVTVIGETNEFRVPDEGVKYQRALVAHLCADGWEPMSISDDASALHSASEHSPFRYFRREVPAGAS